MLSERFKYSTGSQGFTLIEILTSVSILLILLAVSVGIYSSFRPKYNLDTDVRKIESVLRLARSNTLASKNASSFGVHMETAQVVLFEGVVYDTMDPDNKITELDSRNELYATSLNGGGSDVVFNRLDGTTAEFGTVSLRVKSDTSETSVLNIEASGSISTKSEGSIGETNLTQDARHVHFDLGWSIQGATTLEFRFPDIPTTESVVMAAFFNGDNTVFDWSGSFEVGGGTEEFRVHTHALDSFDTELSITRSRNDGKNTEQVEIRIIDGVTKRITTYLADTAHTVNVGYFRGTMGIQ